MPTIEEIHDSLVNGQRRRMVEMIDEMVLYDFWDDFRRLLKEYYEPEKAFNLFTDATIYYFRSHNK